MRPKLIALIAVSAVALVGCASGEVTTTPTPISTESSISETSGATLETVAESDVKAKALKIESTPTELVADDPADLQKNKTYEEQTADFMSFINPEFSGWDGELPPQEDLLSAAKLVCEQLGDGVSFEKVEAIKGSVYKFTKEQEENLDPDQKRSLMQTPLAENNRKLVNAASSAYCLEDRS